MCTGQNAQSDDVHVFLQRGLDDHLWCLPYAGVDDLHAGVAERARDYLGASVMAVESGLSNQYSNRVLVRHVSYLRAVSWSTSSMRTPLVERG